MAHHLITSPDVTHGQNGPKRSDQRQMKRANGTRQAKNKNRKTAFFFIKTECQKRGKPKTTLNTQTKKPEILRSLPCIALRILTAHDLLRH